MKQWYRRIVNNPTQYFILFYTMLAWRFLAVYYGIHTLNLFVIFLITLTCCFLYHAIRSLAQRAKIIVSLLILLLSLLALDVLDTHIAYALYRTEGVAWGDGIRLIAALYPALLVAWLYVQDRYFHPLGMVAGAPFVLLSWFTLKQGEMKVWIILYLFLSLIEASVWVYTRTRKACRRRGLRPNLHKRMMLGTVLIVLIVSPAIFFPLTAFGTKNLDDRLHGGDPSRYVMNFNLYSLGYGDETRLGGPVDLDDTVLMTVEADTSLYLRGNVKDRYTGHTWERTWHELSRLSNTAVHEVDTQCDKYMAGVDKGIKVYPSVATSSVLFTPLNTTYLYAKSRVGFDRYYVFYNTDRGSRHSTAPYTVVYKDIEYDVLFDYDTENIPDAYSQYLQLPDDISPRLTSLVQEITQNSHTVAGKVNAIQHYLLDNYAYTLSVPKPPDDMDFVEHFLFEERRGYCTYFATAAAVMCRIAGIPARYVEGFKLSDMRHDVDGRYILTGKEAHAWVEVLVSPEDRLWKIIECTPGSAQSTGAGIVPEDTMPLFEEPAATPVNTIGPQTDTRRSGYIREHLFLSTMIAVCCLGALGFGAVKIRDIIRRKNSIFFLPSIIPYYTQVRNKLAPAGVFTDGAASDMEEALSVEDGVLRRYLTGIVSLYYDEYYGGIKNAPDPVLRREAYRYILYYARVNKKKDQK